MKEFDLDFSDPKVVSLMERRYPGFTRDMLERSEEIKIDIERALAEHTAWV